MNKVKFYMGNDPYENNLETVENTLFCNNPISINNSKENNNLFKNQINYEVPNCFKLLLNKINYYLNFY